MSGDDRIILIRNPNTMKLFYRIRSFSIKTFSWLNKRANTILVIVAIASALWAIQLNTETSRNINFLITEHSTNLSKVTKMLDNLNSTLISANTPLLQLQNVKLLYQKVNYIPSGVRLRLRNTTQVPFILEDIVVTVYYGDELIDSFNSTGQVSTTSNHSILRPGDWTDVTVENQILFKKGLEGRRDYSLPAGPPYVNFRLYAILTTTAGKKYIYTNYASVYFQIFPEKMASVKDLATEIIDEEVKLIPQ